MAKLDSSLAEAENVYREMRQLADTGDTVVYYQSDTCTPTVSFHWGKDSYKPE